ncbi:hypothetical protein O6H91_Y199000 [Diphasiastrum complanatum]|nr:hypothetical protein O6H91_Y199000 [Diphasiastrum complanatum]
MEGQAILDHFSARLHSIEAAMPSLRSVRRLAEAPHSMQELDHFRSSYEGEPVVFPASSWAPCWKQRLGASSVAEGLKNLLTNVVQVETFRLTYTASQIGSQFKDMVCLADENSTKKLNSERAARKRGPWAGDLPSLTVHNESCTASFNATESSTTALSECQTVCLPEIFSSSVGENYCWDSQLINDAPYLHPIPISTKEHMDFGLFVAEALELISAPKNQLLYLTWRGLPDARQTNPPDEIPEEFVFFLENLLFPTINPPFIPVEFVKQRNIWMGSIVTSQIHFDALDNLHICISNRKVFHLYSPLELQNMHPKPWSKGESVFTNTFITSCVIKSIILTCCCMHVQWHFNLPMCHEFFSRIFFIVTKPFCYL